MEAQALIQSVKKYYPEIKKSEEQLILEGALYLKEHGSSIDISQAEAILETLIELEPDVDTICTVLVQSFSCKSESLEGYCNETITFLHENLESLRNIKLRSENEDSENIKRILIALSKDIRVLVIHLARYLWWLENVQKLEPERATIAAHGGLKIYAPIAEKLDIYVLKAKIEDASFAILTPELYHQIEAESVQSAEQEDIIKDAIKTVEEILQKNGITNAVVEGRKKNTYSVYEKMKRKNFHSVKEVYDLFAVRIITQEQVECYQVLGQIHNHFTPMANRFKDYIAVPKANGYQSIHTTVLGLGSNPNPTEIQIQDQSMYQHAKYGSAAHWAYKKAKSSSYSDDFLHTNSWITKDPEIKDIESEKIFESIAKKVNTERIHVFTPKGDIINLPKDGTPVDFAYAIHSEVGESIINAKVNGNIKPLNYELKSGDVVEVITKKGRKPNPLWLNFVKSQNARGKIKNYLNKARKEVVPEEKEEKKPKTKQPLRPLRLPTKKAGPVKIMIGGEVDVPFKLASCCKPKKNQRIVAYNSRGLEFVVHRRDCRLLEDLEPERFMEAKFVREVKVEIFCTDRIGLLKEILEVVYQENLNVLQSKIEYQEDKKVKVSITVEYVEKDQIRNLANALEKIPNTIYVQLD